MQLTSSFAPHLSSKVYLKQSYTNLTKKGSTLQAMTNKFDALWHLFVRICNAGGILSFNKTISQNPLSWKFKLHQVFCAAATIIFVMTMAYTLLAVTDNFVVTIFTCAGLMIYIAVTFGPLKLVWEYEKFITVIDWCRKLYENENWEGSIQVIAKTHFDTTFSWCMKIMSNLTRLLVLDAFMVTIAWAAVGQMLHLLDKYRAPMPFILPVKKQDTWVVFFVNMTIQFCGNYVGTVLGGLLMSIFVTIFMHFTTYLDVIEEVIQKVVESNKFVKLEVAAKDEKDADFIEVLQEIDEATGNQEEMTMNEDFKDLDHFIQVVVDMLADFYQ